MAIKGENNNKTASSQTCVLPQAKTNNNKKKETFPSRQTKRIVCSLSISAKKICYLKSQFRAPADDRHRVIRVVGHFDNL